MYRQSGSQMLHMLMADGGFDVSGQENIQEVMNKQLLLMQCAAAVGTLRVGGHFVCKTFDLFTPFSAGLLYLLAAHFDALCIHKPATSRPANSERYIVLRGMRASAAETLFPHLLEVNDRINELKVRSGTLTSELPRGWLPSTSPPPPSPNPYPHLYPPNPSRRGVALKMCSSS